MKNFLPEFTTFLFLLLLFSFRLPSSYHFDSDFGRDLMWMYDIVHGKITLIGPKLSFGGYYLGPYYYYLFVPFLIISNFLPWGVLLGNAFIFVFLTTVLFFFLRKRFGIYKAVLAILILSLSPFYLYSARSPGNAFSYLPFLALFIVLLLLYPNLIEKSLAALILGFFTGFIANFHPVSLLYTLSFLFLHLTFHFKSWKKSLPIFILGLILSFAPLILFEVKHGFIMFKNTFIYKSYETFTQGNSPASIIKPSKNPFLNLLIINRLSQGQIFPPILSLAILNLALFYFASKNKQIKLGFYSFILTFATFSFLLRFQVVIHYLFPLYLAEIISTIFLFSNVSKRYFLIILPIWLILLVFRFPKHLYEPAKRNFQSLWQDTKILKNKIPEKDFNIVVIRDRLQS